MKARKFLILFVVSALVPLALAKLSLSMGWFQDKTVNKGEWVESGLPLLANPASGKVHWHLAYITKNECDQTCELALQTLQQLYVGLGRKQTKIKLLLIAEANSTATKPTKLQELPQFEWVSTQTEITALEKHFVIMNQQGMALLRYKAAATPDDMSRVAKDIRTDLLRLMNYDRGTE
jgi:hypothetical protein